MNKLLLSAAMAGILAAGHGVAQAADAPAKEKCYGIAEAGKNDCKSADGTVSCAGHTTRNKDKHDWKFVEAGKCEGMGGMLMSPEANKNGCNGKAADGQVKNGCNGKDKAAAAPEGKNGCKGMEAKEKNGCNGKDGEKK